MISEIWHYAVSAPRVLLAISAIACFGFLGLYALELQGNFSAVMKPLLGALLWNALGWYVAEHGESYNEQVLGTVGLLIATFFGVLGVASYLV